jgi:hypothetical protein
MDVALAGDEKPLEKTKKKAAKDALLSLYLGTWEGEIHEMPGSRILIRYIWNHRHPTGI